MGRSSEGSVSILYAHGSDFLPAGLCFNKSISNARLVCVWGGRGYVSITLIKYFQALTNWIKYKFK